MEDGDDSAMLSGVEADREELNDTWRIGAGFADPQRQPLT